MSASIPAAPKLGGAFPLPTASRSQAASRGRGRSSALEAARPLEIFRSRRFAAGIEQRIRALAGANSWRGALAVAEDWLLIAAAALALVWGVGHGPYGYLLLIPSWIVIGARMRALATLLHEASHKVLAKPRWLNFLFGTVCSGWWVFQTLTRYSQSHVREHHPNLNQPDLDPDAQQYLRQDILDQDPNKVVLKHLLAAVSGAKTLVNLPYLVRDRLLPRPGLKAAAPQLIELASFGLAWATLLASLWATGLLGWFVLIWVVPFLTTFQAINWLIELSEHFPLQWTRSNSFQRTRNRKGPVWERFLFGAHGEGWHRVHHERPYIPFYALKRAHDLMMEDADYRAFETESGGLFVRGPTCAPCILAVIAVETRLYQSQRRECLP